MLTADAPIETMPRRSPTRPKASRAKVERIVLTGFMGSGKTTVGRLLAESLGWAFADLDTEIERRSGMTVPQIFAELGEAQFRRQETAALVSMLGRSHTVIALGGGAPEELSNRLLLEQTPATAVVYLEAPFLTLFDRCQAQAAIPGSTDRPNFADAEKAKLRFANRQRHYGRIAHHTVDAATLSPEEIVDMLLPRVL